MAKSVSGALFQAFLLVEVVVWRASNAKSKRMAAAAPFTTANADLGLVIEVPVHSQASVTTCTQHTIVSRTAGSAFAPTVAGQTVHRAALTTLNAQVRVISVRATVRTQIITRQEISIQAGQAQLSRRTALAPRWAFGACDCQALIIALDRDAASRGRG